MDGRGRNEATPVTAFRAPPLPKLRERPPRGRVLVLAPHPDDETMGLGGTLAHHAAQGDHVCVIFVCNGIQGDPDGWFPRDEIVRIREAEAHAAATVLGIRELRFLGYPDKLSDADIHVFEGLPSDPDEARRTLAYGLAQIVTDAIASGGFEIVYHPWAGELNTDHWLVAQGARIVQEHHAGQIGPAFLGYDVWSPSIPDVVIDTSDTMAKKLEAVRCYRSQLHYLDYEHAVRGLDAYRSLLLPRGATFGEAFTGAYRAAD